VINMTQEIFDVVVVGAGPAGSMAAMHAAKGGAKTALAEMAKLPRDKLCGGGVNAWVIKKLNISSSVIERVMEQAQVVAGTRKFPSVPWPDHLAWRTVSRKKFDYHLTKMAVNSGATLYESTPILSVMFDDQKRICGVKTANRGILRSKVVVGCDGVSSNIARTAGFWAKWFNNDVNKWRERCAYCTEAHFKLPNREIDKRMGNTLYLFYERDLMGYHWIFPKRGVLTVGTGCATTEMKKKSTSYFNDFVKNNEIAVQLLKGARIIGEVTGAYVPFSGTFTPTYGDGVLLAGDSVGMVGAVTGEGIYFAIRAGIAAGEVAAEAALSNDASAKFLANYEKRWKREIGENLDTQVKLLSQTKNPLIAMGLYTNYTLKRQKELFP